MFQVPRVDICHVHTITVCVCVRRYRLSVSYLKLSCISSLSVLTVFCMIDQKLSIAVVINHILYVMCFSALCPVFTNRYLLTCKHIFNNNKQLFLYVYTSLTRHWARFTVSTLAMDSSTSSTTPHWLLC